MKARADRKRKADRERTRADFGGKARAPDQSDPLLYWEASGAGVFIWRQRSGGEKASRAVPTSPPPVLGGALLPIIAHQSD